MATQTKLSRIAINRILLPTDFSPEAQNALECAMSLARRYDATLFLTHVLPTESFVAAGEAWIDVGEAMRQNAETSMKQLEEAGKLASVPHRTIVRTGEIWATLAEVLSDNNIDLIVMGTHGRGGIKKLFLGSTAETVMRHANCPVMTLAVHVPPELPKRFAHILYATDFSAGSSRALSYAVALAEEDRSELTLLHVIESEAASEAELLDWKQQDREKMRRMVPRGVDLECKPEIEVEIGTPEVEILRIAETRNAALIVMGSHAAGAVSTHLPWTTLHHVLLNAPCPVLTVRGE